jgi:hypothetical protein
MRRAAAARAAAVYWLLPGFLLMQWYLPWVRSPLLGEDFEGGVWRAGRDVVAGVSPYPPADLGPVLSGDVPFVYPPTMLAFGVPMAPLPFPVAAAVWTVVLLAAMAGSLWILGVRDWRCYGIALVSVPAVEGLILGNITMALVLGVALAWRYRHNRRAVAVIVGCLVALKPFFWPLILWLVFTGRRRAGAEAVAVAGAALVVSWAAIGFDGLREYPELMSAVARKTSTESYSIFSLCTGLGLADSLARIAQYAVGIALLAWASVLAGKADGDRRAFSVVLIATLALTPLVHRNYFFLLFIVVALHHRELNLAWLLPMALLLRALLPFDPPVLNGVSYQRAPLDTAFVLALAALVLAVALRGVRGPRMASLPPEPGRREAPSPVPTG